MERKDYKCGRWRWRQGEYRRTNIPRNTGSDEGINEEKAAVCNKIIVKLEAWEELYKNCFRVLLRMWRKEEILNQL